ncbi:matrix metalloproteinase-20-like [Narcine bancroftii]|uniref:matrix metalloproteinase-20-like n=1 Tax=Narcine bancroftii TaxID=1343680 RepID=UPI003831429C
MTSDKVPQERQIQKVMRLGIHGTSAVWIQNWLTYGKQSVVVDRKYSAWMSVTNEVLQGSALGPLLFVIFINDLDEDVASRDRKFVDDSKVGGAVDSVECCQRLQHDIIRMQNLAELQMQFSLDNFGRSNLKAEYIVLSLPVFPHDEENEITQGDLDYAQKYIKQFYTLEGDSEGLIQGDNFFSTKIKELQEFYGLQVTGKVDFKTAEVMTVPRCGFPDLAPYSLYPGMPRWNKAFVTYSVVNYVPQLSFFEIEYAIWRAVNVWQKVIPLNLVRVNNFEADIKISFERRAHGDNFPFDGRGGTLAHAFSPGRGIGGDIHFDQEEKWTLRHNGINLFHVATHEFGHALGLSHSRYRSAVMYPTYYKRNSKIFSLSVDDIRAIQHLYGTIKMFNQESAQPLMPDKCDASISFDAVTKAYGDILLFKNEYFWQKDQYTADTKISSIKDVWLDLPSTIDAACEIPGEDKIFFFKGSKFWTYTHNKFNQNSPQSIYLFGLPFYNANIKTMDDGYPERISSRWSGINYTIDAAFQNNGLIYIFSGSWLYGYNCWRKEVVRTLSLTQWLGCQVSEL